jgi:hypothetical protein
MATQKDVLKYFIYNNVRPASLVQDNLIYFSYQSPEGVHDKMPLVLVLEKQLDRLYGINVHYDSKQLLEIITNTQKKIIKLLEAEYYKKYPDNKKRLLKEHRKFDLSLLVEEDVKEFSKKINKKDYDQFLLKRRNDDTMRCYLYKRMNNVSKLTWRTIPQL